LIRHWIADVGHQKIPIDELTTMRSQEFIFEGRAVRIASNFCRGADVADWLNQFDSAEI